VAAVIEAAYKSLSTSAPSNTYLYGESGWRTGGRIQPHKTHQNGLAVDFMVPVVDASGKSVPLPTSVVNKFGYSIEFDTDAKFDNLTVDFDAMAEHLYALTKAAETVGVGISRVIFDKAYIEKLYNTRRGTFIREQVPFMKGTPWIRHDEHYHVDFEVACMPR
jgi:penicillin-insensitive murein endopeptidase